MSSKRRLLVLILMFAGLALIGSFAYKLYNHQRIASKTDQYIKEMYKTNPEGADCLVRWYKKHPDSRPENQNPDLAYLDPPCPGYF